MDPKDTGPTIVTILRNRPAMQRVGLLAAMREAGIGADLKARYDLLNVAIASGEITVGEDGEVKLGGQAAPAETKLTCAYCGKPAQGNYSIHRDGFCKGPEVPLCDEDGSKLVPSCPAIWARISTLPNTEW